MPGKGEKGELMYLNELLGLKYPIIQGGMAHIARGAFAAAVSNAGGLGLIGLGGSTPDEFREQIRICKKNTDKPFGVNLLLLHSDIDSIVDVVIEEDVKVVTTGAGNPGPFMDRLLGNDVKVIPVVADPALAIRMEEEGAHAVIAEGCEAGGHIGNLTTMALLPQVCESVKIPVIAAGGIATGRQLLAAEILGACGVQMGTALLTTDECPVHDAYKEKIISSKSSRVVVIGRINGYQTQMIKNSMTREYVRLEKEGRGIDELEALTLGALKRAVDEGDVTSGSVMAGQVVGQVKERMPVGVLFEKLMTEYKALKEAL